jgi:fucose permease
LRQARWSLLAGYAAFGLIVSSWLGRLPSIRDALGITPEQLGLILLILAVGGLIGVTSVGPVIARFGSRATMWGGITGACVGFLIAGVAVFARSPELLTAGLLLTSLFSAAGDIPINIEAARVERLSGTTLLPALHGAFCVGSLIGMGFAALSAMFGIAAGWHIIAITIVVTVVRAKLVGPCTALATGPARRANERHGDDTADANNHAGGRPADGAGTLAAWKERRTLLIGVVLFAVNMSGAAAANWMNIGVVDGFRVNESIGAAAYMTYLGAMLAVRLCGARVVARVDRATAVRVSIVAAVAGLVVFALAPSLLFEFVGCALWGVGAALLFPLGVQAAADDPAKAAPRVSVVNSLATASSVAIPPVLGYLAEAWGIRQAMLVVALALVASLLAVGAMRPEGARSAGSSALARLTTEVARPETVVARPVPVMAHSAALAARAAAMSARAASAQDVAIDRAAPVAA